MSKTFVVTGASSGIGKAIADRLIGNGHRILRVSRTKADISVDLGTREGRDELLRQVADMAPDGIDGVCTSAGSSDAAHPELVAATNYFGTTEVIEGLYPQLRKPGGRCVAISSVAMLQANAQSAPLEELCLNGDEGAAKAMAAGMSLMEVYPGTKQALSVWARKTAIKPEWAGEGILINIISPGSVETPMHQAALVNPELTERRKKAAPRAAKGIAQPEDVAELADFLLNCQSNHLIGQVIFLDSGSEAILRPRFR